MKSKRTKTSGKLSSNVKYCPQVHITVRVSRLIFPLLLNIIQLWNNVSLTATPLACSIMWCCTITCTFQDEITDGKLLACWSMFCVSSNIIVSDPKTQTTAKSLYNGVHFPPERGLTPRELQFFHLSLASWISLPPSLPAVQNTCRLLFPYHCKGEILPPDNQCRPRDSSLRGCHLLSPSAPLFHAGLKKKNVRVMIASFHGRL